MSRTLPRLRSGYVVIAVVVTIGESELAMVGEMRLDEWSRVRVWKFLQQFSDEFSCLSKIKN